MANILGIEFAPLNIPLGRRLQTLCCLQWVLTFLFGGFGCLFLSIYLLFTSYYWVTLLYIVWYVYDRQRAEIGGNAIHFVRYNAIWRNMAKYFPAKLHKTVDLDPSKSYIFGLHPHGIMQTSGFLSFATEATGFSEIFPGIRPHLLILAGQFMFPFYRDYLLAGGMASVSKASIKWVCERPGHCACIVIGGAIEALEAKPGHINLVLKKRKGFVKQALVNGTDLVPVFSFGENELYNQVDNPEGSFLKKFQDFLTQRVFGFSPPIFMGRGVFNYSFGIMPFRRPLNTVVGEPIPVKKSETPTQEEIDTLHNTYLEKLETLFEANKEKFGVDKEIHLHYTG